MQIGIYLILLASILIMMVNIKFTSLVFAAIFTAGMLLVFLDFKAAVWLLKVFYNSSIICRICDWRSRVFSLCDQRRQYHDILYPGLPVLKSEALKFTPPRVRNKNQISKFFVSFFAHTDNLHLFTYNHDPIIKSKIPFTL